MSRRGRWRGWVFGAACLSAIAGCGGGGTAGLDAAREVAAEVGPEVNRDVSEDALPDASAGDVPNEPAADGPAALDLGGDRITRPDSVAFDGSIDGEQMFCNMLANTAPIVPLTLRGQIPPPDLRGGTLVDGRYELVAADALSIGRVRAVIPSVFQRTIELSKGGTEWQLVELARADANETSWNVVRRAYAVVTAAGGMLTTTPDPCADTGANPADYRYEVAGDVLQTYYPNTRMLLSYLRVR